MVQPQLGRFDHYQNPDNMVLGFGILCMIFGLYLARIVWLWRATHGSD